MKPVKMPIKQLLVRARYILAALLLCGCGVTGTPPPEAYSPVQGSNQSMSVDEARRTILNLTKPPALFFDVSKKTGVLEIASVDIQTTRMIVTVSGSQRYAIPLSNLTPNVFGRGTSACGPSMDGYTEVDLNKKRQGFYFANPTNACWLVEYGENNALTRALTSVRNGAPDIRDEGARQLADAFFVLRNAAAKIDEEEDAHFQEAARTYRNAATKPSLPDDVRRFRVQAEGAIRDKDFDAAANLYKQGLDLAPWWPQGHFNRAIVLSETGAFSDAIVEMRRYLTLVPDAPDANAVQDKIYDWERKAEQ